jgi:hypothetical protein
MRSPLAPFVAPCVALVVASLALGGCGVNRKLKITEVQPNQIELYLDEPTDHRLDLTNMKFKWATNKANASPASGEIDLGIAGEIRGGQFFLIYEYSGHTGGPIVRNFQANIPGIAVEPGYFPGYSDEPGISMGVTGKHRRSVFLIEDKVSDGVTFGAPPRPAAYSSFTEDHSLDGEKPVTNTSINRRFNGAAPVDTNSESDWYAGPQSPGVANP